VGSLSSPHIDYVFFHLLNPEIRSLFHIGNLGEDKQLFSRCLEILRLSVLIAEEGVILPISYLFETPDIERILEVTRPLQEAGLLHLSSPTSDIAAYAEKKEFEFRDQPELYPLYRDPRHHIPDFIFNDLHWLPRVDRSASADITGEWIAALSDGGKLWSILRDRDLSASRSIERDLRNVPDYLEGRAFIPRYVQSLISRPLHPRDQTRIALTISKGYLSSYIDEYSATILCNTLLGDFCFGLEPLRVNFTLRTVSYKPLARILSNIGLSGLLRGDLGWEALMRLRDLPSFRWLRHRLIDDVMIRAHSTEVAHESVRHLITTVSGGTRLDEPHASDLIWQLHDKLRRILETEYEDKIVPLESRKRMIPMASDAVSRDSVQSKLRRVFLVHGRDSLASTDMRALLRAFGFEVVEWSQAANSANDTNPYILVIVRMGFELAQAVVILFTPDENVELRASLQGSGGPDAGLQARPNVWLEAGMALGMNSNRTILVEASENRSASDLSGILFIRAKESDSQWKLNLFDRLKKAGCSVALEGRTEFLDLPLRVTT
jgi:predicted nucleotide-binding protein